MRVTETAHWLKWQDWVNPLITEPFEIRSGHLHIPHRPGIGIDWNEDAIRKYTLS
jgi:mandelate racemase